MELRVLGAHNCESRDARLTSLLIDDTIAIDAGGLSSSLSFEEQDRIKAILITHRHFDHVRDLATFGMNRYVSGTVDVYALDSVVDTVSNYLFDGALYVDFRNRPSPDRPVFKLHAVEPDEVFTLEGYAVLPLLTNHNTPTAGYQVTGPDSKTLFYTGDTAPNPVSLWQKVACDLLVTEVTVPDAYAQMAQESGHLTPQTLKQELVNLREAKGYLPPVITVHMSPRIEDEIRAEVARVAEELGAEITLGHEGMKVVL